MIGNHVGFTVEVFQDHRTRSIETVKKFFVIVCCLCWTNLLGYGGALS